MVNFRQWVRLYTYWRLYNIIAKQLEKQSEIVEGILENWVFNKFAWDFSTSLKC